MRARDERETHAAGFPNIPPAAGAGAAAAAAGLGDAFGTRRVREVSFGDEQRRTRRRRTTHSAGLPNIPPPKVGAEAAGAGAAGAVDLKQSKRKRRVSSRRPRAQLTRPLRD